MSVVGATKIALNKSFSFSLREKAGMRGIIKFICLRLNDPFTLAIPAGAQKNPLRPFGGRSEQIFFVVSALLFAASAAVTIVWCASMSTMGGMPMPGGWTMSMADKLQQHETHGKNAIAAQTRVRVRQ